MRLAPPGSLPWLLAYELRLAWRAPRGQGRRRALGLMVGAAFLLVFGAPLGLSLAGRTLPASPALVAGLGLGALAVFGLMLNTALSAATAALYERGDLELLLSSPLPGRRTLAVRAAAIAVSAFAFPAALVSPLLLPVAVFGHPAWLGAYLVLADLALLAAALGVVLAMVLFRLAGPRAARTFGQALASLLGVTAVLAGQAPRLFPGLAADMGEALAAAGRAGALSLGSPLSWPARAALGQPLPLAGLTALAAAVFALTARGLGERFTRDAAIGAGAGRARPSRGRALGGFGRLRLWTVMVKEWRLIARDPALLSQMMARLAYLLPLGFLVADGAAGKGATAAAVAGPFSLAVGQLAGSFAWLTLSAEAAPDLIAASPMAGPAARRAKLAAALVPVALVFAAPAAALALVSPALALATVAGSTASAVSAGLVNLWMEKPAPRGGLGRRGAATPTLLVELGVGLGWALTTALAVLGSPWALAPAAVCLLVLAGLRTLLRPDRAY